MTKSVKEIIDIVAAESQVFLKKFWKPVLMMRIKFVLNMDIANKTANLFSNIREY